LLVSAAGLTASSAQAQVVSLEDVLASVERHHPKLLAAAAKVEVAEGDRLSAEGAFDVKLAGVGEVVPVGKAVYGTAELKVEQPTTLGGARFYGGWAYGREDLPVYYGELLTPEGGKLKAGATVPLWRDFGTDGARAELAVREVGVELAEAEASLVRLGLSRDAVEAWAKWVSAGQKLGIAAEMLELAVARDVGVARQVETGALAPVERIDNRRAIVARRREVAEAEVDLATAAVKLGLYLRREDGAPMELAPERLPRELPVRSPSLPLARSLIEAVQRRPELRVLERARAALAVERELAENQLAPQVDLGVGAEQGLGDKGAVLGATELHATLTFSLPVQRRKARGKLMALDAKLDALEREQQWWRERIEAEVRQAHASHDGAMRRLEFGREEVELAGQAASAERKLFEAGKSTLLKVNLREEYLAIARKKLVEAQREALSAWLEVELAAGGMVR